MGVKQLIHDRAALAVDFVLVILLALTDNCFCFFSLQRRYAQEEDQGDYRVNAQYRVMWMHLLSPILPLVLYKCPLYPIVIAVFLAYFSKGLTGYRKVA